jgi:hypothetical protein
VKCHFCGRETFPHTCVIEPVLTPPAPVKDIYGRLIVDEPYDETHDYTDGKDDERYYR